MTDSEISIKHIRKLFFKGITCQFLPVLLIGLSEPLLVKLPAAVTGSLSLFILISFVRGYFICWNLAEKYARYKGYSKNFDLLGILNIFGLAILFFLSNKNNNNPMTTDTNPLEKFSISAIFISYIALEILSLPIIVLAMLFLGNIEFKEIGGYLENENFLAILSIPIQSILAWYFWQEMNRAEIDFQYLIGSLKKVNFVLPIGLAIANYFLASGTSSVILYSLSFVAPKYVTDQINQTYATTAWGYIFFAIAALIFAPIMEELFFRGIIFQKLAIRQNTAKALIISASLFAIVHFRSDVISLFSIGVTLAILYLKTKQIIVPIICHFVYNLIVSMHFLYWQFLANVDHSIPETVAKYQQEFIESLASNILFIALSAPCIGYFFYKNFPRNYDVERLPYFANQRQEHN
jgi:membrane protease YdiL (CAAX protease family)